MLPRRTLLTLAAASTAIAGCRRKPGPAQAWQDWLARLTQDLLDAYPLTATMLGFDQGEAAARKARVDDRSQAGSARHTRLWAQRLGEATAFDARQLDSAAAIDLACVRYALGLAVQGAGFPYGDVAMLNTLMDESTSPYVVTTLTGLLQAAPDALQTFHGVETSGDAEAYLARLAGLAHALDEETERLRADAAAGVIPPDFILTDTVAAIQATLRAPPAASSFTQSLARRAAARAIAGDWQGRAANVVAQQLWPAAARQVDQLRALLPRATPDAGVWRLPRGEDYYAFALRLGTTTRLTADDIHRTGLAQVAELDAQLDAALHASGFTQGTVGARLAAMVREPANLYPDTAAGRGQAMADLRAQIADIRVRLPRAFHRLARAPLELRNVAHENEASAPIGYAQPGPADGTRPSIYFMNMAALPAWPKAALPDLTYHEAIPGHIWQGAVVQEVRHLPPIRTILDFNAYTEGWALYAEQLADELGAYYGNPLGRIFYLQSIQFRACRLVVDTGLHAKRWTRQQAIAFMRDRTGNPDGDTSNEVSRYCITPGQACGYKIGQNEINRLRQTRKTAQGQAFNLASFNDEVLASGSVPLEVLESLVIRG